MGDISPMSRDEKLLRKLLGQSIDTEPPQSRIEFLLQEIIDEGGIGGSSYKIKDQYATLAELEAAHPVGADGDAYLVGDPSHIYVWLDDRQEYADGGLFSAVPGQDGNGIVSIEKTGTSGLVDTYTVTYTDGDTDTFTVTNGEEGVGITDIEKTATAGNVDTYTITLSNGDTYNFTVTNGEGVGVPEGGTTGQVLVKKSNTDYDTEWANAGAGEGVPAGGTTGQILQKKSNSDYDTEWVDNEGGSDVTSEIESLSAAASELASETGSLSAENSTQTSEINSLSAENSSQASELASLSTENSSQTSELNSLSSENSTQSSELSSLSQSMSEIASAASSTSAAQSEIDNTQNSQLDSLASEIDSMSVSDVSSELASLSTENSQQTSEIGSLSAENSAQTSEINSLASEIDSMSTSDYSSEIASLHTETSELADTDSSHTSELGSLSQSMSELASAAASTSAAQSEIDNTQDSSLASLSTENSTAASELASLSTENSTQTSEIDSLSTAASEMGSELEVIGSEVAEKQDALVEGPGIDIDSSTNEIKTETVIFTGTLEEWEALSLVDKIKFTHAVITNDTQSGIIDLVPTENSMHAVASGGVYDKLAETAKKATPNTFVDVNAFKKAVFIQSSYDVTEQPAQVVWGDAYIQFIDKNGQRAGFITTEQNTDGTIDMRANMDNGKFFMNDQEVNGATYGLTRIANKLGLKIGTVNVSGTYDANGNILIENGHNSDHLYIEFVNDNTASQYDSAPIILVSRNGNAYLHGINNTTPDTSVSGIAVSGTVYYIDLS